MFLYFLLMSSDLSLSAMALLIAIFFSSSAMAGEESSPLFKAALAALAEAGLWGWDLSGKNKINKITYFVI